MDIDARGHEFEIDFVANPDVCSSLDEDETEGVSVRYTVYSLIFCLFFQVTEPYCYYDDYESKIFHVWMTVYGQISFI